ncbi:putative peptidoglycan lipid II flippase [Elusimicrobium posterum]|uniref:lipid II flippase MurJ n=1 Tax=Elusimicrobium posterum TaxID=3116653 RepID=UPI003C73EA1D
MLNVFKQYSYKTGAIISVSATTLWKLISFINSVLIAYLFGTTLETDIYFYLLMLAGIATNFFLNLNTSAIIPEAMHRKAEHGKENSIKFLNSFIYFYMFLGVLCTTIFCTMPNFWLSLISRFDSGIHTGPMLLSLAIIYLSTVMLTQFLINILEMHKMFGIIWFSTFNAIVPLVLLVFFYKNLGISAMFCGYIISNVIQALAAVFIMFFKLDWNVDCDFKIKDKRFWHNTGTLVTSEAMVIVNATLPLFLMSGFSAGIFTAFNYAKQIFDTPSEIITNRIAALSRIKFNELNTVSDHAGIEKSFYENLTAILILIAPIAVFTGFFANNIVSLFFERGMFGEDSTRRVALFIQLLMPNIVLAIPAYLHRNLATSARKFKEFFVYHSVFLAVSITLIFLTMHFYGQYGYPMAMIAANIFWLMIAGMMTKKHFPYVSNTKAIGITAGIAGMALACIGPSLYLAGFIESIFFKVFFCGLLYVTLFAVFLFVVYRKKLKQLITKKIL